MQKTTIKRIPKFRKRDTLFKRRNLLNKNCYGIKFLNYQQYRIGKLNLASQYGNNSFEKSALFHTIALAYCTAFAAIIYCIKTY